MADEPVPPNRPNIILGRSANGTYYWRVQVFAEGDDAPSLRAAKEIVEEIDADLHRKYPPIGEAE